MNEDELRFLEEVRSRSANPDMLYKIIQIGISGLHDVAYKNRQFAVDMETIAYITLNARLFNGKEEFLVQKLKSRKDMCSLNWNEQIEALQKKADKRKEQK